MKFPVIGGMAFFLSGAAAVGAVALMNPPQSAAAPSAETVASSRTSTVVLSVPMACEIACAPAVRESLAAVPGVERVETDVEKDLATMTVANGFDLGKAIAALANAGFDAKAHGR